MDGEAWWAAVHGVAESWTWLSDFTFTFHFHTLEKEMATHSSVLAWRIPGTGEPGGLPSMGSHRVGHDWSDLAVASAGKDWGQAKKRTTENEMVGWRHWLKVLQKPVTEKPSTILRELENSALLAQQAQRSWHSKLWALNKGVTEFLYLDRHD